jgi:hypothetical protein
VVLRLIDKWLNAGVLEDGIISYPEAGTPQGGVISPLLANIYLHYVLDVWFEDVVKPRLKGRAFLVRYADDFVMGFACEEDARRVLAVLSQRFGKYGLQLHPGKTRLIPFVRPAHRPSGTGGRVVSPSESFDFLGFTHYWSRSKKGNWVVKRKTADSRLTRAIMRVAEWCRLNRHRPIKEQYEALKQKLQGHYRYYGVIGNLRCLSLYRYEVIRLWWKWLSRRKRRGQWSWARFAWLLKRFVLPWPRSGWVPPSAVKP